MSTLDDIKARLQAATPGPWFLSDCEGEVIVLPEADLTSAARDGNGRIWSWGLPASRRPERRILEVEVDTWDRGEDQQADQIRDNAELIANAPTDLARLVAAVEAGVAACDRVIDNADGHKPPGPPHPTREQAAAVRIRAALTAALGDQP